MRAANALVADVLAELAAMVAPGRLDPRTSTSSPSGWSARAAPSRRSRAIAAIRRRCARRSTSRSCTAFRRTARMHEGDILSLDMGVKLNGFYGDSAVTVAVGQDWRGCASGCCG